MNEQFYALTGKVAIVTGGGRGIGKGIAQAFAEAGAAVALVARTQAQIDETRAEIEAAGGKAIAIQADITDLDQLPGIVKRTVAELGGIDIIVNNAGGAHGRPFVEVTAREIEHLFRLEVTAPFELSRLALPHLLERPGACIINTISVGAWRAPRGYLAHYVVKAALAHLTRLMAADLGPKIRVNAIVPGIVETPALREVIAGRPPEFREQIKRQVRNRQIADPIEIGRSAVFLASAAGKFTTGTMFDLTGGSVDESHQMYPDL